MGNEDFGGNDFAVTNRLCVEFGASQPTAQWAWIPNPAVAGTEGSLHNVNSDVKLEAAFALIRKAYELASDAV